MPMPAQICQIWLCGGMISNCSAFAQIDADIARWPQPATVTPRYTRSEA